jgi:hypothetical protein
MPQRGAQLKLLPGKKIELIIEPFALEKRLNEIGARASTNSRDIVGDLSDVIASALSSWADRFRQG